jgi:dTDP-4-amino-4,6-dideoxygalactose transaminase
VAAAFRAAGDRCVLARLEQQIRADYAPLALRLTDSGTSALALAIRLTRQSCRRPLVALPAWSCYDLATAADAAGADVVLYDLDPATLGPEWGSFQAALAWRPHSVVVVHLFGYPVDMNEANVLAEAAGVTLIEDAAQAVGAEYRGRRAGTLAPISILSFGRGKGRTGGGGGALLSFDPALDTAAAPLQRAPAAGALELAALVAAQWLLGRPAVYGWLVAVPGLDLGQTVYRRPRALRQMHRVSAAVLLETWKLAAAEAGSRRVLANRLASALHNHPALISITPVADAAPGYLRFPVLWRHEAPPFGDREAKRLGIMPGYPKALCDLPGFADRVKNRGEPFQGARYLASRLGTLPTHSRLSPRAQAALEGWIARVGR